MKQVNTSGSTLHVPSLGAEFGPGAEAEAEDLIPGFTASEDVETAPAKKAAKKAPAKKAADVAEQIPDPAPEPETDAESTTEAADPAVKE